MNADCAFMIGATHSVCQDYASAKSTYVIISDGCSTSPDTDIGSRLLVRAASQLVSNQGSDDVVALHKEAAKLALHWSRTIGLQPQSVDATLLTAHLHDDELIVGASGDGVIVVESLSGCLDIYSISFPNGFPLYPAYQHQPERTTAWLSNQNAFKEVKHYGASRSFDSFELIGTTTSTNTTETIRLKTDGLKHVALISDGVHSFYQNEKSATTKRISPIALDQVLAQLIAFKAGGGSFVARRAKKFAKQCEGNGWHHADDLAIGAIYFAG